MNKIAFDEIRSKEYHSDRWNRKWRLGLYFSAFHDLGTDLDVNIGIKTSGHEKKWYIAPHALHDGRSALEKIAQENNYDLNFSPLKFRPPLSLFNSVKSLLKKETKVTHHFKTQASYSPSTNSTIHQFSVPAKDKNNTLLINSIAKVIMKKFTTNESSKWMIPVKLNNNSGLNASYLGICVSRSESALLTQISLKTSLKSGKHWGLYYLSRLGVLIGKRAILNGTKKHISQKTTAWLGSISHLGDLGQTSLEEITVIPPVRWHRPIGAAIYQINNRVQIVLAIHESLPSDDIETICCEISALYEKLYL